MPGIFGGGGGKTQVVQQNPSPWEGVQGFLKSGYQDLNQLYRWGNDNTNRNIATPDYYPGSTVAPMSGWTQNALTAQAQRGAQGSPLVDAAQGGAQQIAGGYDTRNVSPLYGDALTQQRNVAQGDMLNSNPYLQDAIKAATDPVVANVNSMFSGAGRYGSGAHQGTMAESIGDISSNMAFGAYQAERGFQEQAAQRAFDQFNAARQHQLGASSLAPTLAMQDYIDINQLGASGGAMDAFNQAQINADVDRWNYNQDADWNRTIQFLSALQGTPWGGQTSQPVQSPNTFSSLLGGASMGAGLAGMLGAGAGSLGSFAGAGAGALLGLFSDERLKTDIEPIGILNNGLPIYSYHYSFDPDGPTHIGVMAQEAALVKPDAVGITPEGFLMVDYERVAE